MKPDSALRFAASAKTFRQILQLLPLLDSYDVENLRDAASAIITLSDIFCEETAVTFEF